MNERPSVVTDERVLAVLRGAALEQLSLPDEQLARLRPDAVLEEVLELDSMAQVILIMEIEEAYGMRFEPEDMERIRTVGDLIRVVRERATQEPKEAVSA